MNGLTSSVIICTRNRLADITQFLPTLARQTHMPHELIIVDSSDVPLEQDAYFKHYFNEQEFSHTRLIYKHTHPGLPHQRNVGVSLASGNVLYFFDDDVLLAPDYLEQMHMVFENNAMYGGGMGTVVTERNRVQQFALKSYLAMTIDRTLRILFLLQRDNASGNFTWSGLPTHAYGTTTLQDVQVLGGCCMAYRSFVFNNHQFDETLNGYAYMEDCDMSWRVAREYTLFYNPRAQLVHTNSPVNRDTLVYNKAMFMRNYRYLFFKNIYSTNRLALLAHWWSIFGLCVHAFFLQRDMRILRGYWRGLVDGDC